MAKIIGCAVVGLLLALAASAQTQPIVGKARVIDGDTIDIAGQRIRLFGIDTPEIEQTCMANGKQYACGQNASFALSQIVGRHWVYCHEKDRDQYDRIVAVCNLAGAKGPEVNGTMVRTGWALAYRQFSRDYVGLEREARQAKVGLWRGEFVKPWDWRRGKRLSGANDNEPAKCLIKGNIGRRGTRIYHVPGGQYYNRTKISQTKGERWFCSEAEAEAAGWRRSKR